MILPLPIRVLLVDDEKDITNSFKMGLELHGFQVDTYNDPTAALARFLADRYDIVVLDYRMPQMSGFELYKKLREIDERTSYVFLTAYDKPETELRDVIADKNPKLFLKKPISINDLAKVLNDSQEAIAQSKV